MKIVILPGNHPVNKEWINLIKNPLKQLFEKVLVLYYSHWNNQKELIDLEKEINSIPKGEIVLAKSVGIILALKAIYEKKINPLKCIFIGTPVDWAEKSNIGFKRYLKDFKIPTLFIQNSGDPIYTSDNLRKLLRAKNVRNYSFYEFKEGSHDYDNFDKIVELIEKFIR